VHNFLLSILQFHTAIETINLSCFCRQAKVSLVLASLSFVCAGTMTGLSLSAAIVDSQPPIHRDQPQYCLRHDLNVSDTCPLFVLARDSIYEDRAQCWS